MKTLMDYMREAKPRCSFDNGPCENELLCHDCDRLPADEDKPNGRKPPVPIAWEEEYGGGTSPVCPACGEMPYSFDRCFFCGQQLIKDDRAREWEKPQEIERMDCFICGGKDTMEFTRSRYNGHKRGRCTACGARFIE